MRRLLLDAFEVNRAEQGQIVVGEVDVARAHPRPRESEGAHQQDQIDRPEPEKRPAVDGAGKARLSEASVVPEVATPASDVPDPAQAEGGDGEQDREHIWPEQVS